MACGNPARMNQDGERLAETPQGDKQQIRQTNKKGKL